MSEQAKRNISIALNVVWGILLLPFIFLAQLAFTMRGQWAPGTNVFFGYATVITGLAIPIAIVAAIALSIRLRGEKKMRASIWVQALPLGVYALTLALSSISQMV